MGNSQRKADLCFQARRKVKVKTISELSQKLWTQKTFYRNWGQTLTYQSLSYTLFFSGKKKKSIDFFCITVNIFLLIPFQKHMVEQLSCFFPTYLPWKCIEHQHKVTADSRGVKPSSFIHAGSHSHGIPLSASRENLLHRLCYPWEGSFRVSGMGGVGGGGLPAVTMEMKPWKQEEPPGKCSTPEGHLTNGGGIPRNQVQLLGCFLGNSGRGDGKWLCRGIRADGNDLLPWPAHGQ